VRQSITASGPDIRPFRSAGSQLHVLPASGWISTAGATERQLLVYLVEGAAVFAALALDARGGGVAAVFVAVAATLLLTGVLFGLSRWHALLDRTVGGMLAVALTGGVPAWLGALNLRVYRAAPGLFRRLHVALLWALLVAAALLIV